MQWRPISSRARQRRNGKLWRAELVLPIHLGKQEMPHGGWTETVECTEINLAATMQRIQNLVAGGPDEAGARSAWLEADQRQITGRMVG